MTPYDDEFKLPSVQLPQWLDIGGQGGQSQQQSSSGGFVSMLKKRLSQPQMKQGKEGMAMGKAAVSSGKTGASGGASL